jgi:hypothetical protein
MSAVKRILPVAMILFVAFVFIQSLFFKFTDAPETAHIFGTLNAWAIGLGLPGVFAPGGIFSQYVIGSAELVAALLLLASLAPALHWLRGYAAALAVGIMSGAIFFHLFTPLGVEVQGDGGLLFFMACLVWISSAALLAGALRERRQARFAATQSV